MPIQIVFKKTGAEIKHAIKNRREQLIQRLEARNATLDEFVKQPQKVRSYLIRLTEGRRMHTSERSYSLYSREHISSEEAEEIRQLCRRVSEIEQELNRLSLISQHLKDEQIFDLSFDDLVGYGFEADYDVLED